MVGIGLVAVAVLGFVAWKHQHVAPPAAVGKSVVDPARFDFRPNPMVKSGALLRPMDSEIFEVLEKGELRREDLLEVFPNKPYRVRFVVSGGERRVISVLIDLNRDGVWDERWDIKAAGAMERWELVNGSSKDAQLFTLWGGRWLPH